MRLLFVLNFHRKYLLKCRVLDARRRRGDRTRGGGQRRGGGGGGQEEPGGGCCFEGHSLIVTNSRSGGDPVATREFSAQHSGKVAFNLTSLVHIY